MTRSQHIKNMIMFYVIMGMGAFVALPPLLNVILKHIPEIQSILKEIPVKHICIGGFSLCAGIIVFMIVISLKNLEKNRLKKSIERNFLNIGLFEEVGKYVKTPKIKVKGGEIIVKNISLDQKKKLDSNMDNLDVALPKGYILRDKFFSADENTLTLCFERVKDLQGEVYTPEEFKKRVWLLTDYKKKNQVYFDKNNVLDLKHTLICGQSGTGKTILVRNIVLNAIYKGWETYIFDVKGSFEKYTSEGVIQKVEPTEILDSLLEIEKEMEKRYSALREAFKESADITAADIGYNPILVIVEEMISLSALFDKEQKKDFERALMNLLVKARQASITIMSVMQNPSSNLIDSTTRGQFAYKILLGNNQRNIEKTVFGDLELPSNIRFKPGEGFIEKDGKIEIIRVPFVQ